MDSTVARDRDRVGRTRAVASGAFEVDLNGGKVADLGKRNVSFSFLWSPVWFYGRGLPELLKMEPPPTHVVFNMGL